MLFNISMFYIQMSQIIFSCSTIRAVSGMCSHKIQVVGSESASSEQILFYSSSHLFSQWPARTHCGSTSCSRPRVSVNRKFLPGDVRQCDGWWEPRRAVSLWLTEGVVNATHCFHRGGWTVPLRLHRVDRQEETELQQEVTATWCFYVSMNEDTVWSQAVRKIIRYKTDCISLHGRNSVKSARATRPNRPLVVKWRVGPRLGGVLSGGDVRREGRCRYHPITTRAGGWRSEKTPKTDVSNSFTSSPFLTWTIWNVYFYYFDFVFSLVKLCFL